jgi:hypothetical protein
MFLCRSVCKRSRGRARAAHQPASAHTPTLRRPTAPRRSTAYRQTVDLVSRCVRPIALLAAAALAGPAVAAVPMPVALELLLLSWDTDGDGRLSASEYLQGTRQVFTQLDANRDDRLTSSEVARGLPRAARSGEEDLLPVRIDTAAGLVSYADHADEARRQFDRLDTDHDGYLTRDELVQSLAH